jgi:hypothetical protein
MGQLLLLFLISAPFLLLLAIHIWRDTLGERRNKKWLCYACGGSLRYQGEPRAVSHYKGGIFLYCGYCANRHGLLMNITLIACVISLVGFLVIKAL